MREDRELPTVARDHWCDLRDEIRSARRSGTGTACGGTVIFQ